MREASVGGGRYFVCGDGDGGGNDGDSDGDATGSSGGIRRC